MIPPRASLLAATQESPLRLLDRNRQVTPPLARCRPQTARRLTLGPRSLRRRIRASQAVLTLLHFEQVGQRHMQYHRLLRTIRSFVLLLQKLR